MINAARNTGGSIGVSLISNVVAHRAQFHQSRLVEHVIPSSAQYQDLLHQVTAYFAAHGSAPAQAQRQAFAWIGQQVQVQASFLAYIDAFWVLMLMALGRAARTDPAQSHARKRRPHGPLSSCHEDCATATFPVHPLRARRREPDGVSMRSRRSIAASRV